MTHFPGKNFNLNNGFDVIRDPSDRFTNFDGDEKALIGPSSHQIQTEMSENLRVTQREIADRNLEKCIIAETPEVYADIIRMLHHPESGAEWGNDINLKEFVERVELAYRTRILPRFGPVAIILFGSMLRGDWRRNCDGP